MTDATDLWDAVKAAYDNNGLVTLTNIRDRSKNTINDTAGTEAAQSVIDLWPAYAQADYDAASALHVEAAMQGVIAVLWRRGGSAAQIARVRWDEVFGADGVISKITATGPRARPAPVTSSGVSESAETIQGQTVRGWSDRDALPPGFLPTRRTSRS